MRRISLLGSFVALVAAVASPTAQAGRPVYAVLEEKDATIAGITGKSLLLKGAKGGSQRLSVGAKTWVIKDGDEGTIEDLRVGQRVNVRYIPRTSAVVTVEVLPTKSEK